MNPGTITSDAWTYVIAAYVLTWLTLGGYGLNLARRVGAARTEGS